MTGRERWVGPLPNSSHSSNPPLRPIPELERLDIRHEGRLDTTTHQRKYTEVTTDLMSR